MDYHIARYMTCRCLQESPRKAELLRVAANAFYYEAKITQPDGELANLTGMQHRAAMQLTCEPEGKRPFLLFGRMSVLCHAVVPM